MKRKAAVNKDVLNERLKTNRRQLDCSSKQAVKDAKRVAEEIQQRRVCDTGSGRHGRERILSAHKNAVVKGDVTALENALKIRKQEKKMGTAKQPVERFIQQELMQPSETASDCSN